MPVFEGSFAATATDGKPAIALAGIALPSSDPGHFELG